MEQQKHISLQSLLVFIVVTIVTFIMSLYGIFTYSEIKNNLHKELQKEVRITAEQLKGSMRTYIESFSPNEYANIIVNEMNRTDILAIVIEDYRMGNVLGRKSYTSGKIRDVLWDIRDFDKNDLKQQIFLNKSITFYTTDILARISGEKMASITVYGADELIEKELYQFISKNVIITIVIYILLIIGIYFSMKLFILRPLNVMVDNLQKTDKDGIPLQKIQKEGSKEIVALESTINRMIDTVRFSREKLQEQKEEFEMIFNSAKDGIAIMDLESNFLECNQGYVEITDFTKEELLKTSCLALTVQEDQEKTKEALQRVRNNEEITNFEKQCTIKNAKVITVNMSMSLLPDKKRILITIKDVTKLKVMESQAKLASMGEMIGNIAHQWRQPLSIISTSASGAKVQKEIGALDDDTFDTYMENIIRQTKYLSETIDDFRNFIKEESKKPKPIHIVAVIEKALTLVESSFKNNYIELITDIEDDMLIDGHQNELIQALINIFNNSKDAVKEKLPQEETKLIFISTKLVDNSIEIIIKDNAGGIDPNIKDRIFEPYFSTKHQSVGTGIGLSLASSIITEHHKGELSFHNETYEYNGKQYTGASFRIVFKK